MKTFRVVLAALLAAVLLVLAHGASASGSVPAHRPACTREFQGHLNQKQAGAVNWTVPCSPVYRLRIHLLCDNTNGQEFYVNGPWARLGKSGADCRPSVMIKAYAQSQPAPGKATDTDLFWPPL